MGKYYILFDGDCGFCNRIIMKIARNDINEAFLFVSNHSSLGIDLLKDNNISGLEASTIILIEQEGANHFYIKSEAIGRILLNIPKFKIIGHLVLLIPRIISDKFYDFTSHNRNKINYNKNCQVPDNQLKRKFIF